MSRGSRGSLSFALTRENVRGECTRWDTWLWRKARMHRCRHMLTSVSGLMWMHIFRCLNNTQWSNKMAFVTFFFILAFNFPDSIQPFPLCLSNTFCLSLDQYSPFTSSVQLSSASSRLCTQICVSLRAPYQFHLLPNVQRVCRRASSL